MTVRVACKNTHCKAQILPSTAKKTGGVCMPCQQKQQKQEWDAYVEANRKDVDPYAGMNDRVEIIKCMTQQREHDPLINYLPYPIPIEQLYQALDLSQVAQLMDYIVQSESECQRDEIALALAAFTNADLTPLLHWMVNNQQYHPDMLFKNANEAIVDVLFERVNHDDENRNLLLLALAWTQSKSTVQRFSHWITSPPTWVNRLYGSLHEYSKAAGWKVDKQGHKRSLFLDKCYPLLPKAVDGNNHQISTCTLSGQSCPWCNTVITKLFEINLQQPEFDFIPYQGKKLTMATCHSCSAYSGAVYMDVTGDGGSNWSTFNSKPDYLPDESEDEYVLPSERLVMSAQARAVDYAVDPCLPTTFSQIGGMPTWEQDCAYPDCPKCGETMVFVGQIDCADIEEYGEGVYYSYLCSGCHITATNYQQT